MTVHALPAPAAATYPALRDRYLRDLTVAGTAARTLRAYRADLDDTAASLAAKQHVAVADLDLRAVTGPDLKDALAEFHSRRDARFTANTANAPATRARSTMRRRVSALRAFFAWAHGDGHLPTNPAVLLRPGTPPPTQPRALSEPVARDVLAARADGGSRWPERDLLVVALGTCAGLRPGESAALALDALDPARPDAGLDVLGKGSRWRHLPRVPAPVCVAAALYLPTRDARLRRLTRRAGTPPRAGTLLLSSRVRLDREGVLTAEPTAEMVSYVVNAVLAEILGDRRTPGMGPHTLRHTFATLAARDGTGMRVLQELLGHADLSTTQRYVHVASEQLTAALTSHPLADAG